MPAFTPPAKPKNQESPISNKSRLLQIGEHINSLTQWPTNRITVIPLYPKKTSDCYRIHLKDYDRKIIHSHFLEVENIVGPTPEDTLQLMLDSPVIVVATTPRFHL